MKKILLLLALLPLVAQAQFVHQSGQTIVDGNNNNLLLRGLGLGGWMLQEGYMLQMSSFAGPQHEIRAKIQQLCGEANTDAFYAAWRANGITKRDIDSLASWGFNSIRLPMHYNLYTLPIEQEPVAGQNTWLDEGFTMTDNLLSWCAANNMYLILDMHATPGGQGKDAAISDYDSSKPSLWESQANKDKLVALWRKLADRYKDSPWIAGYDLINEPNWDFTGGGNINGCSENSNAPLQSLYMAITTAIREVDTHHMIILEGNCWGNNYNGMFPLWDSNMALSFHKYWNSNTVGAIQGLLNLRTQHNVPLWLGESGENSNVWFTDAISLVESLNIGWAFWPMKKIESIAGITDVTKTDDYQVLLNYWQNGGTQPSQAFATATMMQMAENYKMQNVTIKDDVKDAMFRQVQSAETLPYKNHPLPGKVYASEYDLGRYLSAYYDTDIANYRVDTGTFSDWNKGWAMRNDGVDVQKTNDTPSNGFHVSHTAGGEWMLYTLNANADTAYDIDIRYSGTSPGKIHFENALGIISESISLPATGSFTTWATVTLPGVILKQGTNKIKMWFDVGNVNVNYFELKNPTAPSAIAFKAVMGQTNVLGDKISLWFNKDIQTGLNLTTNNLQLKVNGNVVALTAVSYVSGSPNQLLLKPATPVNTTDTLTLTYTGTLLTATDSSVLGTFSNMAVLNKTGNIVGISGQIEAENYFFNSGLTVETTTDTGGGSNIGYTDAGDYLDYLVNVGEAGNYKIEYRHSGESAQGQIKMQLINETTQDIQTVTLPATGGWQTWSTQTAFANLPQGRYYLRLMIVSSGFNLNWVKLTLVPADDDGDNVANANDLCPNTPSGDVVDFNGCTIFSLPSDNFGIVAASETCRNADNGSIAITSAASHPFLATLTGPENSNANFTTSTSFTGLPAGDYTVCITLPATPSFQRCFSTSIGQPQDLAVLSRLSAGGTTVTLDLNGGRLYRIEHNGTVFRTDQSSFELPLRPGANDVVVTTDAPCQGTFRQRFDVLAKATLYPDPADSELHLLLPGKADQTLECFVYSLIGKEMSHTYGTGQSHDLDVSTLQSGTYLVKTVTPDGTYHAKFIKR
ncbi:MULTISPECIES: carbohydrate-binding protein [unclassified Flavobacterium]|uniref:carbohydrate-binding protein n=1 Tax=unclassified Flavobacterium TaxID=196869 RepID=UPI001F131E36|nr:MULTISPECIES: carbohydrate-binding protein [unclassified Flavobacterium]UMY67041.1 carbohydrate-binding protein [Flavobacterium sp. HJ-32-4]